MTVTGTPLEVEASSQITQKEGGLSQPSLEMSLSDSAPLTARFRSHAEELRANHKELFASPALRSSHQ
jgi:hypothetical protein